jgi:hypothetical protein
VGRVLPAYYGDLNSGSFVVAPPSFSGVYCVEMFCAHCRQYCPGVLWKDFLACVILNKAEVYNVSVKFSKVPISRSV